VFNGCEYQGTLLFCSKRSGKWQCFFLKISFDWFRLKFGYEDKTPGVVSIINAKVIVVAFIFLRIKKLITCSIKVTDLLQRRGSLL
jgi:hypothetical protein